jgi:hypothetical protein
MNEANRDLRNDFNHNDLHRTEWKLAAGTNSTIMASSQGAQENGNWHLDVDQQAAWTRASLPFAGAGFGFAVWRSGRDK